MNTLTHGNDDMNHGAASVSPVPTADMVAEALEMTEQSPYIDLTRLEEKDGIVFDTNGAQYTCTYYKNWGSQVLASGAFFYLGHPHLRREVNFSEDITPGLMIQNREGVLSFIREVEKDATGKVVSIQTGRIDFLSAS